MMQRDKIPYQLSVKDLLGKNNSFSNNRNMKKYMIKTFDEFKQINQSVANDENQKWSD